MRICRFVALLLIVACLLPRIVRAEARFRDMTKESGLVTGTVFQVIQDRQGYIWLATSNGLERYDGYSFKVFKHKPDDPSSIASDFVKALYEDSAGRLWLGTYGGGLDLYQPATGAFRHFRHVPSDPRSIGSDKLYSIVGGPNGTLIIGSYDSGIDVFNPESGQIQHYTVENASGLSDDHVRSLFVDSRGEIWAGTIRGLNELDLAHHIVHAYINTGTNAEGNFIAVIAESPEHDLMLATLHGLHSFHPQGDAFDRAKLLQWVGKNIATDFVAFVSTDSAGNLWICDGGRQLSVLEHGSHALRVFDTKPESYDSISSLTIYDIYQDRSGLIWIGTEVGVEVLDPRLLDVGYVTSTALTGRTVSVQDHIEEVVEYQGSLLVSSPTDIYRIPLTGFTYGNTREHFAHIDSGRYGLATAMAVDAAGRVLIGTKNDWVLVLDGNGRLKDRWYIASPPQAIEVSIRGIYQSAPDTYYFATFGNGLIEYHPSTHSTTRIIGSPGGLVRNDQVETMLQLSPNSMLAGTFRGLFEVDLRNKNSSLISLEGHSSAEPVIQALYRDDAGQIWAGTYEGLWRLSFDVGGRLIDKRYYPQAATATSAAILSIAGGRGGNLWLASSNSLLRFNPNTGETLGLSRDQGLPSLEFYSYTHLRASNGWVWFGGPGGLLGFDPDLLKPNPVGPEVVFNEVTSYRHDHLVELGIHAGKPLQLSYEDSIVTFDMAAADFAQPQANTYSYRMIGFTPEWTPASRNHLITFTNLNPGRYRLEVRATNNWGFWSARPAALDIVVLPPWWRTWWAYTIYLLIIIGSTIAYVYSLKRKIVREKAISASLREANEIKSNFVEKLESQVQEATLELRETLQGVNLKNAELEIAQRRATEGEQVKSQFLANMSHELRTPLTGVLGYTKLLTSTALTSEQKDYVSTIRVSSESLLAIINDTLDLSRLEAGKLL
ncbi:MAG TPA: two-component regulator propeller domain-containing protein, partial [Gammaproteobacteria bacterium]